MNPYCLVIEQKTGAKMKYTIKKLATLSGISSRTLRYYDEIGLLKPACLGPQKYRYYSEEVPQGSPSRSDHKLKNNSI